MANVTFKGSPFTTSGELPAVGSTIPSFTIVKSDLGDLTENDLKGKKTILNIFPSVDTGVCAMSVKDFNQKAAGANNVQVINVSADLPFAHGRFNEANSISIVSASVFRSDFGAKFGISIKEKPLEGLLARSVVVVDENLKVLYNQLVPEITDLPDYQSALNAAK